jgi:hypothetical protein
MSSPAAVDEPARGPWPTSGPAIAMSARSLRHKGQGGPPQTISSLRTTSTRSLVVCFRVRPLVSTTASAWA